jgi:hypothetical protein
MKNLKRRLFHAGKMAQKRTTAQGYTSPSRAATFSPFDPKEVTLILDHPAAGVEPIRRTATLRDGIWQSTGCRCR